MTILIGWIVIGVVAALYLIGLALSFGAARAGNPSGRTRVMLILLRLAIGWHFFVEGMEKLHDPSWTSAGYLREATGPLAPQFRQLAGDPVIDKLSNVDLVESDRQAYVDAVASYYHLDTDQVGKLQAALEPVKKDTVYLLKEQKKNIEKKGPYPPSFSPQPMTVAERIAEYRKLQAAVLEKEGMMAHYGSEEFEAWKTAKANANRWRSDLQKDLGSIDHETKRTVRAALLNLAVAKLSPKRQEEIRKELRKAREPFDKEFIESFNGSMSMDDKKKMQEAVKKWREQSDKDLLEESDGAILDIVADKKLSDENRKKLGTAIAELHFDWDQTDRTKAKQEEKLSEAYRNFFASLDQKKEPEDKAFFDDPFVKQVRENVLEKRLKDQSLEPLPYPVRPAVSKWSLLDWSDHVVKYGILAVGAMLLAGLLTRLACVSGAGFLLMFFLAMPSIPGWPESPKAEGHYLYINKNIIEMLALLVLGTTRSGRWLGVDGLLQFLCPSCWRTKSECDIIKG